MKTQEELKTLKQECEALNNEIVELTDDKMGLISGGSELEPRIVEVD